MSAVLVSYRCCTSAGTQMTWSRGNGKGGAAAWRSGDGRWIPGAVGGGGGGETRFIRDCATWYGYLTGGQCGGGACISRGVHKISEPRYGERRRTGEVDVGGCTIAASCFRFIFQRWWRRRNGYCVTRMPAGAAQCTFVHVAVFTGHVCVKAGACMLERTEIEERLGHAHRDTRPPCTTSCYLRQAVTFWKLSICRTHSLVEECVVCSRRFGRQRHRPWPHD